MDSPEAVFFPKSHRESWNPGPMGAKAIGLQTQSAALWGSYKETREMEVWRWVLCPCAVDEQRHLPGLNESFLHRGQGMSLNTGQSQLVECFMPGASRTRKPLKVISRKSCKCGDGTMDGKYL